MSERRPDRGCVVLPGRRLLALGAGLRRRGGGRRRRPLPAHGLVLMMMTCLLLSDPWNKLSKRLATIRPSRGKAILPDQL